MVELANAQCIAITEGHPLQLDTFTVTPFSAAHPDKTVSFHITDGNSSLVYLLDCETQALSEDGWDTLVGYCKNADLVVFDSAYSAIDYPEKKGWGHSTIQDGFTLARASQCKRMMFTHFGFEYSDQELEILEFQATAQDNTFLFAREGLELVL
jgi:ribonuclease BN (tRNA processing enzyme)